MVFFEVVMIFYIVVKMNGVKDRYQRDHPSKNLQNIPYL